MKINWYSAWPPPARQVGTLREIFGADVTVEPRDIRNSEECARHMKQSGAQECVALGPYAALLHVLEAFRQEGLKMPLWADSEPCPPDHPERDIEAPGQRYFRSTGFRRLVHIGVRTEDPRPVTDKRPARVLVWTRHAIDAAEIAAVKKIYGGAAELTQVSRPLSQDGARDVRREMHSRGCDDVLLVAPLSVFEKLAGGKTFPLRAEMKHRQFIRLERVLGLETQFEKV